MTDQVWQSDLLNPSEAPSFLRRGHFVYESGDHGDTWLSLPLLFADPKRLHGAAIRLAEQLRPHEPEVVCGPLVGGALVAQWVAEELHAAFVYAEPQRAASFGTQYSVPRELQPLLRDRSAVVVDDAINAGWATMACVREIERYGGTIVAVGALIVRSPRDSMMPTNLSVPIVALTELPWHVWPASDCPLCRSGVAVDPGP
jgi:orotate phosphoribosyltransferase